GEYRYHDFSQRGTYDYRFFNPDGSIKSTTSALNAAGVQANPFFPRVNNIVGDAHYRLYNLDFNAGYDLTDDLHAYAFGGYGN
ncbi:hypothetical protein AAEJ42_23135, partial [Shewanella algae]|uniref:hypothetical protein n=1 Tax=Shewanella algae TaxID=38313 RepID=UPI00313CE234